MTPPSSYNVLDKHSGFTAITYGKNMGESTLWRPASVLKHGTIGQLVSYNENSFYQLNNNVTAAIYKVPHYRYSVICWFDNYTEERIA